MSWCLSVLCNLLNAGSATLKFSEVLSGCANGCDARSGPAGGSRSTVSAMMCSKRLCVGEVTCTPPEPPGRLSGSDPTRETSASGATWLGYAPRNGRATCR